MRTIALTIGVCLIAISPLWAGGAPIKLLHQVIQTEDHGGQVGYSTSTDIELPSVESSDIPVPTEFRYAFRLDFEQHLWNSNQLAVAGEEIPLKIQDRGTVIATFQFDSRFNGETAFQGFEDITLTRLKNLSASSFSWPLAGVSPSGLFIFQEFASEHELNYSSLVCSYREATLIADIRRVETKDGVSSSSNRIASPEAESVCNSLNDQVPSDFRKSWIVREPLRVAGRLLTVEQRDRTMLPPASQPEGARSFPVQKELIPSDAATEAPEEVIHVFRSGKTPDARIDPDDLRQTRSIIARFSRFDTAQTFGVNPDTERTLLPSLYVAWYFAKEATVSPEHLVQRLQRIASKQSTPIEHAEIEENVARYGFWPPEGYTVVCPEGSSDANYWINMSSGSILNGEEVCETIQELYEEDSGALAN